MNNRSIVDRGFFLSYPNLAFGILRRKQWENKSLIYNVFIEVYKLLVPCDSYILVYDLNVVIFGEALWNFGDNFRNGNDYCRLPGQVFDFGHNYIWFLLNRIVQIIELLSILYFALFACDLSLLELFGQRIDVLRKGVQFRRRPFPLFFLSFILLTH